MEQEILGLEKEGKKSFGRITKDITRKLANLQITSAKVLTSILLNIQLFECNVTNQTSLVPEVRKKSQVNIPLILKFLMSRHILPCIKNERSYIMSKS